METNELSCLLFYSLVCSICIFPVPSPLPPIYFELMYIFYFHVLLSNGLLKADFFFPPFFCSLHWQQQGQTTFTILQNGPQNRYHSCVLFVQSRKYISARTIFFSSMQIMMVLPFLPGFVKQVSWSTCIKRESKKVGSGHSDHKVLKWWCICVSLSFSPLDSHHCEWHCNCSSACIGCVWSNRNLFRGMYIQVIRTCVTTPFMHLRDEPLRTISFVYVVIWIFNWFL